MNKVIIKESQLRSMVENTVRSIVNEINSREQIYFDQINKEFPGAIDTWNKRTPIDEFYLELVNQKKEQDKLQRRDDRKNLTAKRKADFDAKYDTDYERRKKKLEQEKLRMIDEFVDFLPNDFPSIINNQIEKTGKSIETVFYALIGRALKAYDRLFDYEDFPDIGYNIQKLILSDKYEDYFFSKIDEKYGEHVIEW